MSASESVTRDRHRVPVTRSNTALRWRWIAAGAMLAVLPALTALAAAPGEQAAPTDPAEKSAIREADDGADNPDAAAGNQEAAAGGLPAAPAPAVSAGTTGGGATLEEVLGTTADPLNRLERQIEAEEYVPAISELEQRILQIEAESHRFDRQLVRPLTLLGDAHTGLGAHAEALTHYQRALHLSRVNLGLNTPEQVEIVYREAETYKALGDYEAANDREEYAYHVLNRAHDPMDEALLPGIYHLAHWYERTSNVFAARALYEQAMQIIDNHGKLETKEAIPALQGIAASYRMERFPPNYMIADDEGSEASMVTASAVSQPISVNNFPAGEAALQRVIEIRQGEKDEQPIALAEAVLDLADWYTLFDKPRRAEQLYAHAWELMAEVEGFDVVGYFGEPALLYFPAPGHPSPPAPDERGEAITGFVEVAFDVTDDGYVRSLRTVGSLPEELMEFRVRKSLRLARYRPMLVDGVPVAKEAHTYRHEFPYYEEREAVPQTAAVSAGS